MDFVKINNYINKQYGPLNSPLSAKIPQNMFGTDSNKDI